MEQINIDLQAKYAELQKEVRFEKFNCDDAEVLLVAFGLSARVCQKAVDFAREKGIKAGLLRPITLYPFPTVELRKLAETVEFMLVVEMNAGQMVEDVRLASMGRCPVYFKGRMGGMIPSPEEVFTEIEAVLEKQSISFK
jgi:2-oxoglutarate ferredoxin oxidoreductase subunit alpha